MCSNSFPDITAMLMTMGNITASVIRAVNTMKGKEKSVACIAPLHAPQSNGTAKFSRTSFRRAVADTFTTFLEFWA
eukprot:Skav215631  [mRNA]  locus=scaffold620:130168:130444:+ [translate_table: standard]